MDENKLREIVNKLLKEYGKEGAINKIVVSDIDKETRLRAIDMINGEPKQKPVMGEHGSIDDIN